MISTKKRRYDEGVAWDQTKSQQNLPGRRTMAESGMDRRQMVQQLEGYGFSREVLDRSPDEVLAEILRVYGSQKGNGDDYGEEDLTKGDPGVVGRGTSKDTGSTWDTTVHPTPRSTFCADDRPRKLTAAESKRVFAENAQGLKQMGYEDAEHLRAVRAGEEEPPAPNLPRQAPEGKGMANKFAEERFARDSAVTGLSKADYRRIYLGASPDQRAELLGTN